MLAVIPGGATCDPQAVADDIRAVFCVFESEARKAVAGPSRGEVSEVTRLLVERDAAGRKKYGTTLDRIDLSHADWLQHMAEELLDAAGYALAAKRTTPPSAPVGVEDKARAMFEAQADELAAPWDRQWEPTKDFWRKRAAEAIAQQPAAVGEVCEWDVDEGIGLWGADCGVEWTFIEGGPVDNKLRHCPNCGKPVVLAAQPGGSTMTADVELLPLYAELQGHPKLEIVKHYARANVAHATAAKDAEIEALRAEVARRVEGFADRAEQLEARAERLAEALREAKRLGDQGDWRAEREVICTALRKYGQESNDA